MPGFDSGVRFASNSWVLQATFCTKDDDELAVALYAVATWLPRRHLDEPVDKAGLAVMYEMAQLGTARPSDLAAQMLLDVSTISAHLHSLERQGMVARTADPVDVRAQRVRLTAQGADVLARVLDNSSTAIRAATADWPEVDHQTLRRLLRRLADDLCHVLRASVPAATGEPARSEETSDRTARTEKKMENS